MIHRLSNIGYCESTQAQTKQGWWALAVPLPFYEGLFGRVRDAWAVLNGEAYAFHWPEAGEYELAVRREKQ